MPPAPPREPSPACTFSGNGTDPIGLAAANSGVSITDDNTYNGAIRIESGAIASNLTWGNGVTSRYYVSGPVTVDAGSTLTVLAGTVIKFATGVPLYVNGTLSATGSQSAPVYFTDYRDDEAGGDTNGDGNATSPAAGWWIGILVQDGGAANLDYCRIHYGGGYHGAPLLQTVWKPL